jgi:hypothetical protein
MGGDERRVVGLGRDTEVDRKSNLQDSESVCPDTLRSRSLPTAPVRHPLRYLAWQTHSPGIGRAPLPKRSSLSPSEEIPALSPTLWRSPPPRSYRGHRFHDDPPFRAQAHRPFLLVFALNHVTVPGLGRGTTANLAHRSGGGIATEIGVEPAVTCEKGGGRGAWQRGSTGSGPRRVGRGGFCAVAGPEREGGARCFH